MNCVHKNYNECYSSDEEFDLFTTVSPTKQRVLLQL